jgi:hypothetical protein
VICVEDLENAGSDAAGTAEETGHSAVVEPAPYPSIVMAILAKLDTKGKRQAFGVLAVVCLLGLFGIMYLFGLGSMTNQASAATSTAAAAAPEPAAPVAEAPAPVVTEPVAAAPAVTATPTSATETETETAKAEDPAKAGDTVLVGASKDAQLPDHWSVIWGGSVGPVKSATGYVNASPNFKLTSGYVRLSIEFKATSGNATVFLVRVKPGIAKWAMWEGDMSAEHAPDTDPRFVEEGTYQIQVVGDPAAKIVVQQ